MNEAETAQEPPNLQQVTATLDHVLFEQNEPIVIAINAGWGEGKTYFWKNEYTKAHNDTHIGYVSVFAMESINDIRQHVLSEALSKIAKEVTSTFSMPTWLEKTRVLSLFDKARQNWNYFISKFANKIGVPENLSTKMLEDEILKPGWILCFDDIERLPEGINLDVFLGYINELKDLRKIKIVLIYSENNFGDNKEIFDKYHEKVIDRQLLFLPDIRERLKMVFNDHKDIIDNQEIFNELERCARVLKLKNIRLISKLKHYYSEAIGKLSDPVDPEFKKAILTSLLLFICIRHNKSIATELPDFGFLTDYSKFNFEWGFLSANNQTPEDPQKERFNKLFSEYGFTHIDDLDKTLINLLETDILDVEKFIFEYKDFTHQTNIKRLEEIFSSVWKNGFHGTLEDNTDTFCDELIKATEDYIEYIPIGNLDITLVTLDSLGRSSDSEKLLEQFTSKRISTIANYDTSAYGSIKHTKLSELYDSSVKEAHIDSRSIDEVIDKIMEDDIISQKNRERLDAFTIEDFVRYFTSLNEPGLTTKIHKLGTVATRFSSPDPHESSIEQKVREAAKQIADQNPLNILRMEYIGLVQKETNNE